MEKADAIKSLYSQRDKFVLVGLTGRTGSGCTTVADILSKESINELDLRSYKTCDYKNADERKYSVVYRFMKEGKRRKKFIVIEASSIIFSFILEKTYGDLFDFIDKLSKNGKIKEVDKLKEEIVMALSDQISEESKNSEGIESQRIEKSDIIQKLDRINEEKDIWQIIEYFTVTLKKKKINLEMC